MPKNMTLRGGTTIKQEEDVVIDVSNADVEELNGLYYPTEEDYEGIPIYSQTGNFKNRRDDSFFMWCYEQEWWISTMKQGGKFQEDEVDYYQSPLSSEESSIPPGFGWEVSTRGTYPAPKVRTGTVFSMKDESVCTTTMAKMLFSEKFSDVHFHCPDGTILHAHKNILSAASPYFATVFEGPWGNEHPNDIWNTLNSAELMKIILTYIYTGVRNKDEIMNQPFEILALAHEHQLRMLVKSAETILIRQIEMNNIKDILQNAELYNLERLKQYCFDFIKKNGFKVVMNTKFMKLASEDESLWGELQESLNKK